MSVDDPAALEVGRLLGASAVLELGSRDGRLGDPARRLTAAPPARRLAAAREPGADDVRALARALRTTALRRLGPGERDWVERLEAHRRRLAAERGATEAVFAEDPDSFGGSWDHVARDGPVAEKCSTISIPPRWAVMLVRLIAELRPRTCVELGTGFGLSAAFIAAALELNGEGALTTFEGAEEWAAIAREGAAELRLERLEVRVGPLSETLPAALPELAPVDFAFVDAEHTEESTLRYFGQLLPHLSRGAVVVFDDITWTWEAWERIRDDARARAWAALGRMGVLLV